MTLVQEVSDLATRVAQEFKSIFTGETYTGSLDSAPFGYRSFVGTDVTNEPAGYSNGLVFTAKNEDDSGRVQLAYSISGDYAIRWRLGGSWSSWSLFTDLDNATFTGLLTVPTLKVTTGAAAGKILVSDADGDLAYADSSYDFYLRPFADNTVRAAGNGDMAYGLKIVRAFRILSVTYRCRTADASGNLVVEIRKNGSQQASTVDTIAAANQVAGHSMTGLSVDFAAGDILLPQVTGVGITPGFGLDVTIEGRRL